MFFGGLLYGVHFVFEGFLYLGRFISWGFRPRWLFDSETYCPVAFVRGLLPGASDLEQDGVRSKTHRKKPPDKSHRALS